MASRASTSCQSGRTGSGLGGVEKSDLTRFCTRTPPSRLFVFVGDVQHVLAEVDAQNFDAVFAGQVEGGATGSTSDIKDFHPGLREVAAEFVGGESLLETK